jgi:hypothetical protein
MNHHTLSAALTAGCIAAALPSAYAATAQTAPAHPHPVAASTATAGAPPAYLNGGVGKDDAARMHAAAKDYTLQAEFSQRRDDEFVAGTDMTITDAHGKTVLHLPDAGPITLVKLAPGAYTVAARLAGQTETRSAKIESQGTARLYFHWAAQAKAEPRSNGPAVP